jgi:hypothetical protein
MKNMDLKNKLVILGVCALLFFSGVAFPFMLAATPENRDLETIEADDVFPAEEQEQPDASEQSFHPEPEPVAAGESEVNINAITKERALEIAKETFGDFQNAYSSDGIRSRYIYYIDAKYMDSSSVENVSSWFVFIELQLRGEQFFALNENYTSLEELLDDMQAIHGDNDNWFIDTNNEGRTVVIRSYHYIDFIVVEINALTGELVSQGTIPTSKDDFNLDWFSSWDGLKVYLSDIVQINPDPPPIPGAHPIPTPEPYPGAEHSN